MNDTTTPPPATDPVKALMLASEGGLNYEQAKQVLADRAAKAAAEEAPKKARTNADSP